jgi:hypothetical protein
MPDLNFDSHDTLYATHGLRAYVAKCQSPLKICGRRVSLRQKGVRHPAEGTQPMEAKDSVIDPKPRMFLMAMRAGLLAICKTIEKFVDIEEKCK